MIAGRKCTFLWVSLVGSVLLLTSSCALGRPSERVVLDEGKIGRSVWGAWLEPAAKSAQSGEMVCRGIALASPTSGGLWAQSEYAECGVVSEPAPLIDSIDRGQGKRRRTVWLGVFSAEVRKIYVRVGHARRGKVVSPQRLSPKDAKALGTDQLAFWVHGYAGNSCLHRLITYGPSGATLSDSGKASC